MEETYQNTNFSQSGLCTGQTHTNYSYRTFSGVAAINGTYDAAYVKFDAGVLVEANPNTECAYWFFPYVDISFTFSDILTRTYTGACSALNTTVINQSGTRQARFDTYSGTFIFDNVTYFSPQFELTRRAEPSAGFSFVGPAKQTNTFDNYACQYAIPFVYEHEFGIAQGIKAEGFVPIKPYTDSSFTAGKVGFSVFDSERTYAGQLGRIVAYNGFGPTCEIHYQDSECVTDAFSELRTYSADVSHEIAWGAYTSSHSILINA